MDASTRDLVGHLFAAATVILEDATEITSAGQSRHRATRRLLRDLGELKTAAADIAAIANAIDAVIRLAASDRSKES